MTDTIPRLNAHALFHMDSHGYASYIRDPVQLAKIHCHSYYELFLVAQGTGTHHVNGQSESLTVGCLYCIRPDDVHCYTNLSAHFCIINMVIPEEIMQAVFSYLGTGFSDIILKPKLPPRLSLPAGEMKNVVAQLEQLVLTQKIMKEKSALYFRVTIFQLLTKFLTYHPQESSASVPQWLRWLSLEMLKKENFTEGLPAMYRLSGKSVEHLSRCCQKYLGKTPTQLINDIRLDYVVSQLLFSERKIIDISEDAGFDSLSHFYHVFKRAYNMSPAHFRETMHAEKNEGLFYSDAYNAEIPESLPFQWLETAQ